MNSSPVLIKEDADPAVSIGVLALLASLLVGSLFYLGSYSMGQEFIDKAPRLNRAVVAEGAVR